ncbi:MAG: hypothetical protein WCO89_11510 [Syntrophus sp. (in: bacteria)]
MNKTETLKRDIDLLPPSMLVEVEHLVKKLKRQYETDKKPATLLSEVAAYAIEDDLPTDLAEQHDHYLYGVPKK